MDKEKELDFLFYITTVKCKMQDPLTRVLQEACLVVGDDIFTAPLAINPPRGGLKHSYTPH